MWYRNIGSMFFCFVTKHACDRQTDRQNYDREYRASIAASRGKNVTSLLLLHSGDLEMSRWRRPRSSPMAAVYLSVYIRLRLKCYVVGCGICDILTWACLWSCTDNDRQFSRIIIHCKYVLFSLVDKRVSLTVHFRKVHLFNMISTYHV